MTIIKALKRLPLNQHFCLFSDKLMPIIQLDALVNYQLKEYCKQSKESPDNFFITKTFIKGVNHYMIRILRVSIPIKHQTIYRYENYIKQLL